MKIKCLMLDVDGVLIDGRPEDGRHWKTGLLDDLGIAPSDLVNAFFRHDWPDIVIGKVDIVPALEAALTRISSPVGADVLMNYWFQKDARIIAGVMSDCQEARAAGLPVYLTTNQEHKRVAFLMETLGLKSKVDGIIYSAQAGSRKPQPAFYSYAQGVTGYDPRDLLLVDDTLANVKAAITAGWSAVHWDAGAKLSDILRDKGWP